jgi:MYXO-CTERM domain-containing protein
MKALRVALAAMCVLGLTAAARAGFWGEDFSYTPDNVSLKGQNGGTGDWGGAWTGGTSTILIDSDNSLSYAGYGIEQTGTGLAYRGQASSMSNYRSIGGDSDMMDSGWFSLLVENADANATSGCYFYSDKYFGVRVVGTDLQVNFENHSTSWNTGLKTLAIGETHLIVGKYVWNYSGGTDYAEVWADPPGIADEDALGDPDFIGDKSVLMNIRNPALIVFGGATVDAFRISNGQDAFRDVVGDPPSTGGPVPEPAGLGLLGMGLLALRRRRD